MTISIILNGHTEGLIFSDSIRSALRAQSKIEMDSEIHVVLDRPDSLTLQVTEDFSSKIKLSVVDFGDLGLARNFGVDNSEFDNIAFLDGDDLWSENWLAAASAFSATASRGHILHPQLNYYFNTDSPSRSGHITRHISSTSPEFDFTILAQRNYWTALSFGAREIYKSFPFRPVEAKMGTGFEDWCFNIESLGGGVEHLVVPKTAHFIREKAKHSMRRLHARRNATFNPVSFSSFLS